MITFGLAFVTPPQDSEAFLRKGIALMHSGRLADAEATFQSIRARDAHYSEAQSLLGFLCIRRAALPQAEQAFRKVLEIEPDNASAHFGLGMTFAERGNLDQAAREFELVFNSPEFGDRARLQWIQNLFYMGREKEAFEEARACSERFPSIAQYQSMLGFLYHTRGQEAEAEKAYRRAVELDPSRLSDHLCLIAVCHARKDWNGALQWIKTALQFDDNQPLLYEDLANVFERLQRPQEAATARQDGQRKLNAELLYTQAVQASLAGRIVEAERELRECLRNNPRLSKAWADLGELFRKSNQADRARDAFLKALEINPGNYLAKMRLAATIQGIAGEGDVTVEIDGMRAAGSSFSHAKEAKTTSEKSKEIEGILLSMIGEVPDNPDLLTYLGYMREATGKGREALDAYNGALRVNPLQVEALIGKARYSQNEGDLKQAIEGFRQATALEPSNIEAWRGLIRARVQEKNGAAAEKACQDCLAHTPNNSECRELLAQLKLDASDFKEAADEYQTVLRNGKASKEILDGLAFSLMQVGDRAQAIGLFHSSLKRYGPDIWVYANLGHLHRLRGDYRASVANYRKAKELSPRNAEINHNLGFSLYLAKDFGAAVEPFQIALRSRPDWGLAHFNLAMTYWNLSQHALALVHARIAEEKGIQEAKKVVITLSASFTTSGSRAVSGNRRKK